MTVTVMALPAVALAGTVTTKCVAAAALTVTVPLPVSELLAMSVAVDRLAARCVQRGAESAGAAGQSGIGRQRGRADRCW